jgi:hypothetical protein
VGLEIRPVLRDELDQGLPLFAGYQRFYGVLEPDDEQNRLFLRALPNPPAMAFCLAPGTTVRSLGSRAFTGLSPQLARRGSRS